MYPLSRARLYLRQHGFGLEWWPSLGQRIMGWEDSRDCWVMLFESRIGGGRAAPWLIDLSTLIGCHRKHRTLHCREREQDRVVLSILSTEACHNMLFYGTFCIKTLNWVTHNENDPEFSSWQGSKWAISQNTMRKKKNCVIDWSTWIHLPFVILVLYNLVRSGLLGFCRSVWIGHRQYKGGFTPRTITIMLAIKF